MKKNNLLIISVIAVSLTMIMLLGTSYSLITKNYTSNSSYSLTVGNIQVDFNDSNNIILNNVYPVSDLEGLQNAVEFIFTVNNNGDYDANYSLSIEETSKDKIGNIIRYSYNKDNNGYNRLLSLKDSNIIVENMVLRKGESATYRMKFWISEEATSYYMNKSFSAKIIVKATQNHYKYATSVIEKLYENNVDNVLAVNFNGEFASENIREYRYTRGDANNYVWFNCIEGYTKGDNYCEKWRIIGSFYNHLETSNLYYRSIKLVRDDVLRELSFNDSQYKGDFDDSYVNYYLNEIYYNSLNISARKMIMKANWNIGLGLYANLAGASYESEMKKTIYQNIGLINASDYGYAFGSESVNFPLNSDKNALQDNWLNTQDNYLTINKINDQKVNIIKTDEKIVTSASSTDKYFVRPAVYLRADVSIINGYGTFEEPYELAIKFPINY